MTLKEAWDKAKVGQTIFLEGICETKTDCINSSKPFYIKIKKEIDEYPRKYGDSEKQTLRHVLRCEMTCITLEDIFSDKWEIIKEKKTGWINIYRFKTNKGNGYYLGSHVADTKEEAKKYGNGLKKEFITTIKIEWEE